MLPLFIQVRVIDIIDIILVAFLMYQVYLLIRGTVAFNIFVAIIGIWLLYFIVNILKMKLLTTILGGLIGGGVIALIILFQQEIRRFLIFLGSKYFPERRFSLFNFIGRPSPLIDRVNIEAIHKASLEMSGSYTGALIVIERKS